MDIRNRPRHEIYQEERAKGMSYREIAEKHGVTKQAVAQSIATYAPSQFKPFSPERCIYDKLRKWLNDNEVSCAELLRRMGLVPHGRTAQALNSYLRGKHYPTKQYIDELLRVTGLTYEQLFWRAEDGK